jgi:hypothetical protein
MSYISLRVRTRQYQCCRLIWTIRLAEDKRQRVGWGLRVVVWSDMTQDVWSFPSTRKQNTARYWKSDLRSGTEAYLRISFQVVSSKAIGDSFAGTSGVFVLFPAKNKIALHFFKVRPLCKSVVFISVRHRELTFSTSKLMRFLGLIWRYSDLLVGRM